ncbi:unnamed protein product, partial [marine sediment metagenome]
MAVVFCIVEAAWVVTVGATAGGAIAIRTPILHIEADMSAVPSPVDVISGL